jgi:hypothetical protein
MGKAYEGEATLYRAGPLHHVVRLDIEPLAEVAIIAPC